MAPVGSQLAGELPVPEAGRRDGVGVCVNTGVLLSTGYMVPVEVGREEKIGTVFGELEDRGLNQMLSQVSDFMQTLLLFCLFLFNRLGNFQLDLTIWREGNPLHK